MELADKIKKRFAELSAQGDGIRMIPLEGFTATQAHGGDWHQWATSVLSLLRQVFGEDSPHYLNFQQQHAQCYATAAGIERMKGVFQAAKEGLRRWLSFQGNSA